MSYQTNDAVQLLLPLQEGVLNLQRHFPDWEEVRRLADDVTAVERRLSHISPRLLTLVGRGAPMSLDEEHARITHTLEEKYGR